ncbi:MAG: hypothetical protein JXR97_17005, partial [Planctomycetes bacterium]|nr:hypothetical protein [Planctomycetota bacterium]
MKEEKISPKLQHGYMEYKRNGGTSHYLTLASDGEHTYMLASDRLERIGQIAGNMEKGKEGRNPLFKDNYPAESIVVWLNPDQPLRGEIFAKTGSKAEMLDKGILTLSREGTDFRLTARCKLDNRIMEKLYQVSGVGKNGVTKSKGNASCPLPRDTGIYACGKISVPFFWHGLNEKLWSESNRPLRGVSQPISVFAWEWLDKGIMDYATGGFSLRVGNPPKLEDTQGVPPAPVISGTWNYDAPRQKEMVAAFTKGGGDFVDWLRAPGGSELFETVRKDTSLTVASGGDGAVTTLHLQPLFFNHMQPSWHFSEGVATFTTDPTGKDPTQTPSVAGESENAGSLMDITAGWNTTDPGFLDALNNFVTDKAERHGFVPEEKMDDYLKARSLANAALKTIQEGTITAKLTRTTEKGKESAGFIMNGTLSFSLAAEAKTNTRK